MQQGQQPRGRFPFAFTQRNPPPHNAMAPTATPATLLSSNLKGSGREKEREKEKEFREPHSETTDDVLESTEDGLEITEEDCKSLIDPSINLCTTIIKLNIGGHKYVTTAVSCHFS